MKTINYDNQFRRVTDEQATKMVRDRGWKYCAKWEALKPGERQDKKRGKIG